MNTQKRTEAQKRADQKYKATKVKRFTLDFSPADMELYDHIQAQDKKQTYIKNLIREDMKGTYQQMLNALCDYCQESLDQHGMSTECEDCGWYQKREQP